MASFVYELPFGKGKKFGGNWNPVLRQTLGNWQANGILSLRTGTQFGINTNAGVGYIGKIRPNIVAGKSANAAPAAGRSPDQWFDIANFTPPAPYTNGNLGNQTNAGPPGRTLDMSLFKDVPINERLRIQFRAEGFNVSNTPQFDVTSIGFTQGNANFGKIATTFPTERKLQLSLRLMF